ncbi:MAG: bifunctional 3-(3-hydroxy-phenyl)propionate/3-hydroxycinnamic acid hydroxylase [Pseudomonadota bacterium]
MDEVTRADVVVVGAGPCGVTLANYLGTLGVNTLLLDRSEDILDYPRAVGVDDESLRSWQGIGLASELLEDMIQNVPARYHNSRGECFAEVAPGDQPFGWPRRNLFIQPLTEATLRKGLQRFEHVRFAPGVEVRGLVQDDNGVRLDAISTDGKHHEIHAQYVVGSDGGRSKVRELIGVSLEGTTDTNKWLVVDVLNDPLDAPFTEIHCHPVRPSFSIHLPYGYRRLEFLVKLDEKDEDVLQPAYLETLMRQHYPGVEKLPEIKRARIYLHHSRTAEKFSVGRVFLAGDAAHLQPPFFGQGMNSGQRDATNLGWKLAWVVKGKSSPRILETYSGERRGHALAMVNFATWIGRQYQPMNRFTEWLRDLFFKVIQKVPGAKEYVLQLKFKPMARYMNGIVLHSPENIRRKDNPVGRLFIQPSVQAGRQVLKLDDFIGPKFAVLGIKADPWEFIGSEQRQAMAGLDFASIYIRPSKSVGRQKAPGSMSLEAEDVHGRFRDWLRKSPQWQFVILRPDRYVAAVCTAAELDATIASLVRLMK